MPSKTVHAYLAALHDPSGGAALYDLYADDAMVLYDGGPMARQAIARETYAEAHEAIVNAQRSGGRSFPADAAIAETGWRAESDTEGVAWVQLTDPAREAPIWLALGLRLIDDTRRVVWSALADHVPTWDFALGRAMALSEFPFLASQRGMPARDWLDVGYRRQFFYARPPLVVMPGQNFSCHGTGTCCTRDWDIETTPEGQAFVDAIPWETLHPPLKGYQLTPKPNGKLAVKHHGEPCPFLDENTRCRIHSALGTPVFSSCVAFPYRFVETPDGVAVTTSFHCASVRSNVGLPLASQSEEIYKRLGQVGLMSAAEHFRLAPDQEGSWEEFRDLESELRTVLGDQAQTPFRRMWIATRTLHARLNGEIPDPASYAVEPITALDLAGRQLVETYVPFMMRNLTNKYDDLAPALDVQPSSLTPRDAERVMRWFQNLHFSKEFSYVLDLSTAHTLTVLLYYLVLTLDTVHGERGIPKEVWTTLGTHGAHRVFARTLTTIVEGADFLRKDLGDPSIALLFLRYFHDIMVPEDTPALPSV